LSGQKDPFANILEFIDPTKYLLLPNTSGAMNAEEAVRLARLAVAAGLPKWVKLGDRSRPRAICCPIRLRRFSAAEVLVKEGFTVLPYINADPVLAKRLAGSRLRHGDAARRTHRLEPAAIQTRDQIRIILEQATVPVVVDAGIGAPEPRGRGDGAGRGRRAGEHRHRRRQATRTAWPWPSSRPWKRWRAAWELGLGAQLDHASPTSPLTAFLN
jgi:thiazole synthase